MARAMSSHSAPAWAAKALRALIMTAFIVGSAQTLTAASVLFGAGQSHSGWLVMESDAVNAAAPAGKLLHIPGDGVSPGLAIPARSLPELPMALAAWGDRVSMVFAPRERKEGAVSGGSLASVRSLTATPAPAPGFYIYEPEGRFTVEPSLPVQGELIGFVDTRWGLVALQRDEGGAISLSALWGVDWTVIDLPKSIKGAVDHLELLAVGDGFALLVRDDAQTALLWQADRVAPAPVEQQSGTESASVETDEEAIIVQPRHEVKWTRRDVASLTPEEQLISAGDRLLAASRTDASVSLSLIADSGHVAVARIENAPQDAVIFSVGEKICLAWREAEEARPHLIIVSAITGRIFYDDFGAVPTLLPLEDIQFLGILLSAVVLTILVFLLKPEAASRQAIDLPQGAAMAEPGQRLFAALIDIAPALFGAQAIWGVSALELLAFPLQSPAAGGIWPLLTAIGIYAAHSAAGEALAGRTLGKALLGLQTVSIAGGRPTPWQALSRTVIKAVAPPITLFVVVDPNRRHAGDIVAGTLVIRKTPPASNDESAQSE